MTTVYGSFDPPLGQSEARGVIVFTPKVEIDTPEGMVPRVSRGVRLIAGEFSTPVVPGPYWIETRIVGSKDWAKKRSIVVPDQESIEIDELLEATQNWEPMVVGAAQQARDAAVAAKNTTQALVDDFEAGIVPDAAVAARIAEVASATRAAVDARVAQGTAGLLTKPVADAAYAAIIDAPTNGTSALATFQSYINSAQGRPLFVPPGTYTFDGSLTGRMNLTFAPGAKVLQTVNAPVINPTGTGSEPSRALQAAASAGQNIIQCSTSGLAAGDWILVRSPNVFPNSVAGSKIGELHRIRQIDGSGQLRTLSNLDHAYPITTSSVVRFGMLEGVRVIGGEFANTIGANMKVPMLRFTACADLGVDVAITDAGGQGVTLSACTLFDVRARVRGSLNDESNGNFGYGVEVFGATCHGRVTVDMVGGRHAFTTTSGATTASVPRHIDVYGIAEGTTNTAWDSHEEGEYINFRGVTAFGCRNGAIKHRSPNSSIIDPIVRNCLGIAVRFAPSAVGGTLNGGELRDIRYLSDGSPGVGVSIEADDVVVSGEPRIDCDDQAIVVADGADRSRILSGMFTAGKRGNAATDVGIDFQGTSVGHRVGSGVAIEDAATGVKVASTVSDVRVASVRYEAVTTRVDGVAHLVGPAMARRVVSLPQPNPTRSTLTPTSGRAYLMPVRIVDDRPWLQVVSSFIVTSAGANTDTVEVAVYDTSRNRLATTGQQTGLDSTGLKTLPALNVELVLGRRYLVAVQFVSASVQVHAGGFSTAAAAVMLGTSDDLYDGAYNGASAPLPASLGAATAGVINSWPWLQLTSS